MDTFMKNRIFWKIKLPELFFLTNRIASTETTTKLQTPMDLPQKLPVSWPSNSEGNAYETPLLLGGRHAGLLLVVVAVAIVLLVVAVVVVAIVVVVVVVVSKGSGLFGF